MVGKGRHFVGVLVKGCHFISHLGSDFVSHSGFYHLPIEREFINYSLPFLFFHILELVASFCGCHLPSCCDEGADTLHFPFLHLPALLHAY